MTVIGVQVMEIQKLILPVLISFVVSPGCQQNAEPIATPLVVDSLKATFEEVRQAALEHDEKRFFSLLDPTESADLQVLARRHGYASLTSYIGHHYSNWPNLDTLRFRGLRSSGDYIRLSMSGPGSRLRHQAQVRHTFILFRSHPEGWRLAGMSNLENLGYDQYGHEVTVHETDLPPSLRFPRHF